MKNAAFLKLLRGGRLTRNPSRLYQTLADALLPFFLRRLGFFELGQEFMRTFAAALSCFEEK